MANNVDLSTLIKSIPVATENEVITPQFHNSLREALIALIDPVSIPKPSGSVTRRFVPMFIPTMLDNRDHGNHEGSSPVDDDDDDDDHHDSPLDAFAGKAWVLSPIGSVATPGEEKTSGWMPLSLPTGTRLESMKLRVIGKGATSMPANVSVTLYRRSFTVTIANLIDLTTLFTPLITAQLSDANGHSTVPVLISPTMGGEPPPISFDFVANMQSTQKDDDLIDNDKYAYILVARAEPNPAIDLDEDGGGGSFVALPSLEITCKVNAESARTIEWFAVLGAGFLQ